MLTRGKILSLIEEEYGNIEDIIFDDDDEMQGLCLNCGEFTSPVEPDARNYPCPGCEANEVFAVEEVVITLL